MELGMPQRLIVHLEKMEDVPHATLRSLIAASESRRTTHAILCALLKAEELADRVNLTDLTYHKLMVYVGPLPTVRLCWGTNAGDNKSIPTTPLPVSQTQPVPAPDFTAASMFGSDSFFGHRGTPGATVPQAVSEMVPSPALAVSQPMPSLPAGDEKTDPLARFKKMPDLSKFHR
jgi:hypothetical protein